MRKVLRSPFLYGGLAVVVGLILIGVVRSGSSAQPIGLGDYEGLLQHHQVATATIHDNADTVTGKLRSGQSYTVNFPDRATPSVLNDVARSGATYQVAHSHSSIWTTLLESYLPIVLLFGLLLFLLNSTQAGGTRLLQFGRAKAKTAGKEDEKVTFADVAGAGEAVAELEEIKEFLESPARFHGLGAKIPRGVLLIGPPGTGKTLLARAVAGEAGVPFFSISGSDFVEMFVGVGASRVRDLFQQAKANAPSIVFVDEIDAVGRHRGAGVGGGHDEREQTLNQLLVEMDGFDASGGVILIAATNRPDILDPALLRPGRFDRQIAVDRPDLAGRQTILAVHARGKPLHPSVDLATLAKRTPGFTGADLANLLNEAALLTARRNLQAIGMRECEEAIDRVLAGPERKTLVMSEHDKAVTAYHEAGHVVVGHVLPHADPIHKVSIVARSRSLGLTFTLPEDKFNHSRSELRDAMAMCMGGRTAEELVFDEPTTGAENDIEKATTIARSMVTEYGMSDRLGPQQLVAHGGEVFLGRDVTGPRAVHSDEVAAVIDGEVRALIDEAHQRARAILAEHRRILDALAGELVAKETLDTPELMAIIGGLASWPAPGMPAPPPPPASAAPTATGDARSGVEPDRGGRRRRPLVSPASEDRGPAVPIDPVPDPALGRSGPDPALGRSGPDPALGRSRRPRPLSPRTRRDDADGQRDAAAPPSRPLRTRPQPGHETSD